MSVNFRTEDYQDSYLNKFFVSFKDRFMTEGGPSLILRTLNNSDQMLNSYLFKVGNKARKTLALFEQHVQS